MDRLKTGGRKKIPVPCGWCGREQKMSGLMNHLRLCNARPGGPTASDPQAGFKADNNWHGLTERAEDLVRMIPDLRGRYSMRRSKDELLNAIWKIEDFMQEYSRRMVEELGLRERQLGG